MYRTLILSLSATVLSGCLYNDNGPVIFGTATTLGVSVASTASGTAPEMTVGFREGRFMSAPTFARDSVDPEEEIKLLSMTSDSEKGLKDGEEDTVATYAEFKGRAGSPTDIHTIFATGHAARIKACGNDGTHKSCSKTKPSE